MLVMLATAAIVSGTSILLLKIVDTILQMGDFRDHWSSVIMVTVVVLYLSDTQLQFLNLAIKLYDQLEVIPIYQTFLLFSWSSIGLLLFNEYKYYSQGQILGIFGAATLCLIGVKALTSKRK